MKTRPLAVMVLAVWVLNSRLSFAQKSDSTESVPDYEISKEIKLKGVIDEVRDRVCLISGSMGSHLMVKIGDKIYEVHVAPVRFVKMYGAVFQKGDRVEIIGVMTKFQGVVRHSAPRDQARRLRSRIPRQKGQANLVVVTTRRL